MQPGEWDTRDTVLSVIGAQIAAHPSRIAIQGNESAISYGELGSRVDALCEVLRAAGVAPSRVVAVVGGRSVETIVAILATLRLGGVYLPVAPETPRERFRFMLEDSGAFLTVITKGGCEPPASSVPTLVVDGAPLGARDADRSWRTRSDDAYLIYTSGSTGRPKAALLEHAGLWNRIEWMRRAYQVSGGDAILLKTPFVFDVSIWEIFLPLVAGARMVLLPDRAERFPPAIIETVERYGVTLCHFIPSLMGVFLHYVAHADVARLKSLRRVFCSGEALTVQQAELFGATLHAAHGTALTNLYGPTEATVDVTYYDCVLDQLPDPIPIGRPICNVDIRIRDGHREVEPGTVGELCIGGIQVAKGYLNRPELNAERFTRVGDERLYRSGDLARLLPDGNIEYLGRMDHQIKIRGMRIELGEIERAVIGASGVWDCIVVVDRAAETIEHLVAFVMGGSAFNPEKTLSALKDQLPDYMLPRSFVPLDSFPRLDSGKVDRKALQGVAAERRQSRGVSA